MKFAIQILASAWTLSMTACSGTPPAAGLQAGAPAAAAVLVWADEFDTDGPPDPENWIPEEGFVRNDELQLYDASNAACKDGLLIIEARRERVTNPDFDPESSDWRRNRTHAEFTSACLKTAGKRAWLYGRFEMRARIDTRPGLWPTFWTMGSAREWPGCGEIDIMECYRGRLLGNACWGSEERWTPIWDSTWRPIAAFEGAAWSNEFHVWHMDWSEDRIELFVDGELWNSIDLAETVNPDGSNPFHEPHYVLLNLAIGGTNGGDPAETRFPARFEIDYVRVYQKRR